MVQDGIEILSVDPSTESPLIMEDFNFDGTEDVAIRNGNYGSYGAPSYDVYIFDIKDKKFVPNEELTHLASSYMGFFGIDTERKRLIVYAKSGAALHYSAEYTVMPNRGLVKVYELEEDAGGGERVKVTKKEFIDDKWITNVKDYPIEEYYK